MLTGLRDAVTDAEDAARLAARAKFQSQALGPLVPAPAPAAKKPAAKKTPAKTGSKPAPVAKKAADAVRSLVTSNDGSVLGMPKKLALILGSVAVVVGGLMLFGKGGKGAVVSNPRRRRGRRERVAKNPRSSDPEVQKAIEFREAFHWGYPARRVERRRVSPAPRVLVELGKVAEITYRTKKKGESARLFTHDFEGKLPTLAMDVRNKRLHVVGGSYTVTADGITG